MIKVEYAIDKDDFHLDVDLSFPAKGITALYGASGSGKTTLLRAMAGLDRYKKGYFAVGDKLLQHHDFFVSPHRRSVGYVFQEASLFEHLTVENNIKYGWKRLDSSARKLSLSQIIDLLDLSTLLKRHVETLSGGERQRVAIARALAASPHLLLMDEPLSALDHTRKREIIGYILSVQRELDIPVVYVSHDTDEIMQLADYLVVLDKEQVIAHGQLQELITRSDLAFVHQPDAEALIEAKVTGHDKHYHLTVLEFSGMNLYVAHNELQKGDIVRVRIAATDVSLTLKQQSDTSIQNIFPATVAELLKEGDAQYVIRLEVGGQILLSRVTKKSVDQLAITPNKKIFAQVKTVSLLS